MKLSVEENEMLERLEQQQKQLRDQYNSLENEFHEEDFNKIIKADVDYSPREGESLISYVSRLLVFVQFADKKNIKTHINGPKGAWYTHRNPQGCYSCEDVNLRHVMLSVIGYYAKKYPDATFSTT